MRDALSVFTTSRPERPDRLGELWASLLGLLAKISIFCDLGEEIRLCVVDTVMKKKKRRDDEEEAVGVGGTPVIVAVDGGEPSVTSVDERAVSGDVAAHVAEVTEGGAPTAVEPSVSNEGGAPTVVEPCLNVPEWKRLRALTLVLAGPMKGQPYKTADFTGGLKAALGGSLVEVLAFGPLNRNFEWHVTVRTEAAKEKLLDKERLVVKETCVFHVRALVSPLTRVRVHWAPYYLPMGVIARQLARHGEVVATSWETGPKEGEYAIPTGVRVFTMKGVKVADVPHLITVALGDEVGGDTAELLVTIPGRKPLCLRCRRVGHVRRDCTTPYCRHHGEYGHSSEQCTGGRATYARAARPQRREEPVSDADQPGEAVADRPGVAGDAAADRPGVMGDAAADRPGVTGEARTAAATRQAVMATTSVSGGNVVSGEAALRLLSAAAEARLPVDVAGCSQSVLPAVASTSDGPAALSSVLSLSTYDPDWPALGQLPPDTGRAFSSAESTEGEQWTSQRTLRRRKRRKSRSPAADNSAPLFLSVDTDVSSIGGECNV